MEPGEYILGHFGSFGKTKRWCLYRKFLKCKFQSQKKHKQIVVSVQASKKTYSCDLDHNLLKNNSHINEKTLVSHIFVGWIIKVHWKIMYAGLFGHMGWCLRIYFFFFFLFGLITLLYKDICAVWHVKADCNKTSTLGEIRKLWLILQFLLFASMHSSSYKF